MKGKVAVIVGGASGFGYACAKIFAAEGAEIVIAGRRGALATETANEFNGLGVSWDVTDFEQGKRAQEEVMAKYGRIDAAINFAGYDDVRAIREITPDHLEPMVNVQFNGAIYFLRFMCNAMADSGGGSAILCSSLTAHNPNVGRVGYAGSKAGLEYVAKLAAVEYGHDQVRVNCIAPHVIETEMTSKLPEDVVQGWREAIPLKRGGLPKDVANSCVFLASDLSNYITGQVLHVDGGMLT